MTHNNAGLKPPKKRGADHAFWPSVERALEPTDAKFVTELRHITTESGKGRVSKIATSFIFPFFHSFWQLSFLPSGNAFKVIPALRTYTYVYLTTRGACLCVFFGGR